jgi:SAM-dependent methyltransferase
MGEDWLSDTRMSYDADVTGYVEKVRRMLDSNPYLRTSLALFAELVRDAGDGLVADVGCGPGYVTRHLQDLGVDGFGVDLSAQMVALAQREYPDLRFEVGTMTDLGWDDCSIAGIVAFWSIVHVPDQAVPGVFEQFRRVWRPGSPLLIGFHAGRGKSHTAKGYTGRAINLDSYRREPGEISAWLREAGFGIEAELVLRPDEDVPGAIVIARKPG